MVELYFTDNGWQWYRDSTSTGRLKRVVQSGGSTDITFPSDATWLSETGVHFTSIGVNCFDDAEGHKITSILSMPTTVTLIRYHAFYQCTSLSAIDIGAGVTTLDNNVFSECTGLSSITIPDSVIDMGEQVFYGCSNISSVTIGTGLTTIPNQTFNSCYNLVSITIPSNITEIGMYAFLECTSLISMIIPNSVTLIGSSAFYGCTSMTSIDIGIGVTTIDENVFSGCTVLTSIKFYGLTAPTSVGDDWILDTPAGIRGHAYAASDFPTFGNDFYGLIMGDYIPAERVPYSFGMILGGF